MCFLVWKSRLVPISIARLKTLASLLLSELVLSVVDMVKSEVNLNEFVLER